MTATTTRTAISSPAGGSAATRSPKLWRPGIVAGLTAAAATTAVAAVAHGLGVSLETAPGEAIPVIGFGQLTLVFTAIGVLLARTLRGRARQPRSTFTRATIVLTVLSLVPDMVLAAAASTKMTLVLTHLVAAAIVIPTLSSRLPERGTR
jgi:flagellar biosynthesis protein FliP